MKRQQHQIPQSPAVGKLPEDRKEDPASSTGEPLEKKTKQHTVVEAEIVNPVMEKKGNFPKHPKPPVLFQFVLYSGYRCIPPNCTIDYQKWTVDDVINWIKMFIKNPYEKAIPIIQKLGVNGHLLEIIAEQGHTGHFREYCPTTFHQIRMMAAALVNKYRVHVFDTEMVAYRLAKKNLGLEDSDSDDDKIYKFVHNHGEETDEDSEEDDESVDDEENAEDVEKEKDDEDVQEEKDEYDFQNEDSDREDEDGEEDDESVNNKGNDGDDEDSDEEDEDVEEDYKSVDDEEDAESIDDEEGDKGTIEAKD